MRTNNRAPHGFTIDKPTLGKTYPAPLPHLSDQRPPQSFAQTQIAQTVQDHRDPPIPIVYGTLGGGMSAAFDQNPLRTMRSTNPRHNQSSRPVPYATIEGGKR